MKDVSEIFEEIVNAIDNKISINSISIVNGKARIYTCDTKWLRIGKKVSGKILGGSINEAYVTAIDVDKYFEIDNVNIVSDILAPKPTAMFGTRTATNNEWNLKTPNLLNKTPLIWCLELVRETHYGFEYSLERDIELKVFFLDETDILNYATKDHRLQVVKPMIKLAYAFKEVIDKNALFKRIVDFNIIGFSRFGTESVTGMVENILDANLSGASVQFNVSKYKEGCKC
jgi:hypothetical protein